MSNYTDTIPHLNIEVLSNGMVRLENESMGESYAVDIHLIQLRHIAETVGLVRKMSAAEADTMRAVIELRRRLLALKDRIDHLGEYLALHSRRSASQAFTASAMALSVAAEIMDTTSLRVNHTCGLPVGSCARSSVSQASRVLSVMVFPLVMAHLLAMGATLLVDCQAP